MKKRILVALEILVVSVFVLLSNEVRAGEAADVNFCYSINQRPTQKDVPPKKPPWNKPGPNNTVKCKLGLGDRLYIGLLNYKRPKWDKCVVITITGDKCDWILPGGYLAPEAVGYIPGDKYPERTGQVTKDLKRSKKNITIYNVTWDDYQPIWEWIEFKRGHAEVGGKVEFNLTFDIKNFCIEPKLKEGYVVGPYKIEVNGSYGVPGQMRRESRLTEIWVFPESASVDTSETPLFSAPPESGSWISEFVYVDPNGDSRPQGGVKWSTSGTGLTAENIYELDFGTCQKGNLIYSMFVYDNITSEYESFLFEIDDPMLAQNPSPPHVTMNVLLTLNELSWLPGWCATSHDVYFGTSFAEVSEASNTDPMGETEVYRAHQSVDANSYSIPETLDIGQTYFWRIDEVNDPYLWRGEVWSFETQSKAREPYPTHGAIEVELQPVLSWTPGFAGAEHDIYFGTNVEEVNNMEADDPDPNDVYRGRQNADDSNYVVPEYLGIETPYYWRIDEVNDSDIYKGDVWRFTTISAKAKNPYPADGAEGIYINAIKLIWTAGPYAASHDVYFGTNYNDVANADDDDTTGIFRGNQTATEYDLSNLDLETTYYWRIDEVNLAHPDVNWLGDVWSFTIPDYITVDDFEYYTVSDPEGDALCPYYDGNDLRPDRNNDMRYWWLDGHVQKNPQGDCGGDAGDYNPLALEASVGRLPGSRILRTCGQSGYGMNYFYDNDDVDNAQFPPELTALENKYSEILRYYAGANGVDLTPAQINANMAAIELNYKGQPSNDCDPVYDRMYVGLRDINNKYAYIDHPNPNAARIGTWQQWAVKLSDFTTKTPALDLNKIRSIRIGFGKQGNKYNGTPGGEGTVIFDDIRLFEQRCVRSEGPVGDITGEEGMQDCMVDFRDLDVMADEWLDSNDIQTDLYEDGTIDFRDYAMLAEHWLEEQLWP